MKTVFRNISGAFVGAAFFLFFFGYKILNPLFFEWRMTQDPAQHFLGWHFFRSEPWKFPLGFIQTLQFPQGTSIVYTDSIPLLAIPLKIFSSFLPAVFQYQGMWLLLCYMLQGIFAMLLMNKITKNTLVVVVGVLLFVISPIMFNRTIGHESLVAHWIIIASLYLYFSYDKQLQSSGFTKWTILIITASLVHAYFLFMVLFIWSAFLLQCLWVDFKQSFIPIVRHAVVTFLLLFVTMWLAGYFVTNSQYSPEHFARYFGYFSMNLNAPFNPAPMDSGALFKARPFATSGQYEGFNYLGLGILTLLLITFYELFRNRSYFEKERDLPLIALCFVFIAIALSNKVTLDANTLFEFQLPDKIIKIAEIFRSSGRMFWPVTYILITVAVAFVIKFNTPKKSFMILSIALFLQLLDFYPYYLQGRCFEKNKWESPMKSDLWQVVAQKYKHIAVIPATNEGEEYVPLAMLAAGNGMTLNIGYCAREDYAAKEKYRKELMHDFENGRIESDTLYILKNGMLIKPSSGANALSAMLDGYAIIAPGMGDSVSKDLKPWPFTFVGEENTHSLGEIVELYADGYTIVFSAKDDAISKIPADFVKSMKMKGSKIADLAFRGAYAAVIRNGKLVEEKINNKGKVMIDYNLPGYEIKSESSGCDYGNKSIISINGISCSKDTRGMNVIVIDEKKSEIRRYAFDTFSGDNPKQNSK